MSSSRRFRRTVTEMVAIVAVGVVVQLVLIASGRLQLAALMALLIPVLSLAPPVVRICVAR